MNSFKKGVRLVELQPQTIIAYSIGVTLFNAYGYDCIMTSCNDGNHGKRVKGALRSLHYVGLAFDLRTKHIQDHGVKQQIADELRSILNENFDILFEDIGGINEHIHIEYDPKVPEFANLKHLYMSGTVSAKEFIQLFNHTTLVRG